MKKYIHASIQPSVETEHCFFFVKNQRSHQSLYIKHQHLVLKPVLDNVHYSCKTVDFLNPGQVPIVTADQTLYALCKQIQWRWPDLYGEEHFIVMCGGLHIEMNAFKMLGDLLVSSRWTGALTQANIATSGTADSYLKVSHLTRTRHAHQVTASALYVLLHKAYTEYCSSLEGTESL